MTQSTILREIRILHAVWHREALMLKHLEGAKPELALNHARSVSKSSRNWRNVTSTPKCRATARLACVRKSESKPSW